jgi:hypothetical protein
MREFVSPYSVGTVAPADTFQVAAAGDLKCTGGYCRSGGTYGTTAMYSVLGEPVCRDCAVKLLGLENLSGREQQKVLNGLLDPQLKPGGQ